MNLGEAEALRLAVGLLEERLGRLPGGGLGGMEMLVLAAADELGADAFPTAIGDRLRIRRSNVSVLVSSLAQRGLLEHAGGGEGADGRRRPVALTAQGRRVLNARENAGVHWLMGAGTEQLTAHEAGLLADAVPLLLRLARS